MPQTQIAEAQTEVQNEKGSKRFSPEGIFQSMKEKTTRGIANFIDRTGRVKDTLLFDPRAAKVLEATFGVGMVAMLMTGNAPEGMDHFLQALPAMANLAVGRQPTEMNSNVNGESKVAAAAFSSFFGMELPSTALELMELMPEIGSTPLDKAKGGFAMLQDNMKRLVTERNLSKGNNDLVTAASMFGQKLAV